MPTLYSNACFIAIDCTAWHAHTCCASHALRAARATLFALPVPAVPYGFVLNRPFTVRMSCMLCAASACRRRGACGASVHRRRLCACANCNHPACTAEHCTLPPRVTQAPARPSHDESSVHCRCQAGQTRMPKPLHTTACMLASCPCSCTALHCTVQAGQR
jgi:hypothetical protein